MDKYTGGLDRLLSEITITRVDGGYKAVIKDHDTNKQKSCLALQLMDVPRALEDVLNSATAPWEAFKSYKNKKGVKKFEKD